MIEMMEKTIVINADQKIISVLKKIVEMKEENNKSVREYYSKEIVAFSISGDPISRTSYRKELKKAELEIKNKEVISQEDLESESENW